MPEEQVKKAGTSSASRSTPLPGLREARKRKGLTQRELATLAGTGAGTVCDLENGNRGGYPATIKRLCTALSVTPAELMDEHSTGQE